MIAGATSSWRAMSVLRCLEDLSVSFEITEAPLRLGRALQPSKWLKMVPDEVLRNTISRAHLELRQQKDQLLVRNLSPGGSVLNGCILEEALLREGDILGLGHRDASQPAVQFRVCPLHLKSHFDS